MILYFSPTMTNHLTASHISQRPQKSDYNSSTTTKRQPHGRSLVMLATWTLILNSWNDQTASVHLSSWTRPEHGYLVPETVRGAFVHLSSWPTPENGYLLPHPARQLLYIFLSSVNSDLNWRLGNENLSALCIVKCTHAHKTQKGGNGVECDSDSVLHADRTGHTSACSSSGRVVVICGILMTTNSCSRRVNVMKRRF